MAVLEKIRVKFGLAISIIIALALLSFIIDPSQLESALNTMSSKYDVGQIAGKSVSYTDFQAEVDKYTTVNDLLGSSASGEAMQEQIREAAWQGLVDKFMFVKNAKAAGIKVGDDELVNLTTGDNISPLIAMNPAFVDETGTFSVDALKSFLQSVEADQTGRLRVYWNYLQSSIQTQQYYAKYGALFNAGSIANALQVAEDVNANNTTADLDYVLSYYPVGGLDSTITVSSSEIKKYYNDHKSFFKQRANRNIEYVVFEVVPSAEDVAATSTAMEEAYKEFATTDNLKTFLLRNSEQSYSTYWYKRGDLNTVNASINDQIFGGEELTSIVPSGNSFYAARVINSKMIPDSVFVKHILLQGTDAKKTADSLATVLSKNTANFSNLVAEFSLDQASAADGELGSIGWMTQTYMIPGFESVIEAQLNQPFVLDTQYGTHVVLVTRKTAPVAKKQVAILEKTALASKETFNAMYAQANTFATLANGSYEGYKKAVDSTKVYSHTLNVTEATSNYGSVDNAKEITRWVFDNKAGKASNIITVNNNFFFIAAVKDVHKEGYAELETVSPAIRTNLYNRKAQDKTLADVKAKIAGASSVAEAAEKLGVAADRREGVSLASTQLDPALLSAALSAKEGQLTGPVLGTLGVYVLSVSNVEKGEFYTEADAKNLVAQKAQYTSQMIIPVMQEYDNVKDNRARFY